MPQPLTVFPLRAPVQSQPFDLIATLRNSLNSAAIGLEDGDVVAISSKYAAIAEGRIVAVDRCPTDGAGAATGATVIRWTLPLPSWRLKKPITSLAA